MLSLVLIESPYRQGDRNQNLRYLAWCEFHSASLGETPISSHGNCTAYWSEDDEHRAMGFAWRDKLRSVCKCAIYYTDLGMSSGMRYSLQQDTKNGLTYVYRQLPSELIDRFRAYEHPPGSMRRIAI
jgi:hypothetical protein